MNEDLKLVLPVIVGMAISLPIMILVDLTKQDQTSMFLILLPMMAGVAVSLVVALTSVSFGFGKPRDRNEKADSV